jgi:hypothetical protein
MQRRSRKKVIAGVLGALLAVSAVTGAVAYFTGASNNATSSGTVGTSTQWGVSMGTPTWSGSLTALYPGAANDTEQLPFTVTNNGSGHQQLGSVTVSMPTLNGDVESSSGEITGCKASWFTAVLDGSNGPVPVDLTAGGTYNGTVDLTMSNASTSQDACKGASPQVTVTAS